MRYSHVKGAARKMSSLRNLLALIILLSFLPVSLSVFRACSFYEYGYLEMEEEIELMKLREVLLLSYELERTDHELHFLYQNKPHTLSLINGKLILQPGTVIYLSGIEDLRFYEKNGCIAVFYTREGREYEKTLVRAESLYLRDFPDHLSELPESLPASDQLSGDPFPDHGGDGGLP